MVTTNEILDIFKETGADPFYENPGNRIQAHERAASIAESINNGDRTLAEATASIEGLKSRADAEGYVTQWNQTGGYNQGVTADTVVDPGTTTTTPPSTFVDPKLERAEQRREMKLIYSWLPSDAIEIWIDEWVESGNTNAAWATIRNDPQYERWFPGNLTEDGRVRYSEEDYAATVEGYRDIYRAYQLNTDLLDNRMGDLIRGEVSPSEFATRVDNMWTRVISATDSIQATYARLAGGIDLTPQAMLAGALDPEVGREILENRISMAEIGGEALGSGFQITAARMEELVREGMTRQEADQLYGEAERIVPLMNTLVRRHNDPDDDFDVEEFTNAEFFRDPQQNLRMQRMISMERAMFRGGLGVRQGEQGALTGLIAR